MRKPSNHASINWLRDVDLCTSGSAKDAVIFACLRNTAWHLTVTPCPFLSDALWAVQIFLAEMWKISMIFPWVFLSYDSPTFLNSTRSSLVSVHPEWISLSIHNIILHKTEGNVLQCRSTQPQRKKWPAWCLFKIIQSEEYQLSLN